MKVNRRTFLQTSSAAAGGLAATAIPGASAAATAASSTVSTGAAATVSWGLSPEQVMLHVAKTVVRQNSVTAPVGLLSRLQAASQLVQLKPNKAKLEKLVAGGFVQIRPLHPDDRLINMNKVHPDVDDHIQSCPYCSVKKALHLAEDTSTRDAVNELIQNLQSHRSADVMDAIRAEMKEVQFFAARFDAYYIPGGPHPFCGIRNEHYIQEDLRKALGTEDESQFANRLVKKLGEISRGNLEEAKTEEGQVNELRDLLKKAEPHIRKKMLEYLKQQRTIWKRKGAIQNAGDRFVVVNFGRNINHINDLDLISKRSKADEELKDGFSIYNREKGEELLDTVGRVLAEEVDKSPFGKIGILIGEANLSSDMAYMLNLLAETVNSENPGLKITFVFTPKDRVSNSKKSSYSSWVDFWSRQEDYGPIYASPNENFKFWEVAQINKYLAHGALM